MEAARYNHDGPHRLVAAAGPGEEVYVQVGPGGHRLLLPLRLNRIAGLHGAGPGPDRHRRLEGHLGIAEGDQGHAPREDLAWPADPERPLTLVGILLVTRRERGATGSDPALLAQPPRPAAGLRGDRVE